MDEFPFVTELRRNPPTELVKIGDFFRLLENRDCDRGPCDRRAFYVLEVAEGTDALVSYVAPVSEVTPEAMLLICLCLPCLVDAIIQLGRVG